MRECPWTKEEREEHLENIRARLKSFYCSICDGWITPKDKRPYTVNIHAENCGCPKGTHKSFNPDVTDEDVEWLIHERDWICEELSKVK